MTEKFTSIRGNFVESSANGLEEGTWAQQFHLACKNSEERRIMSLLNVKGAKVDIPDIDMYTPLHHCCKMGLPRIVKILIDYNAELDASHPGLDGWTPLHIAAWKNHKDVVDVLLDHNASVKVLDWYGSPPESLTEDESIRSKILAKRNDQSTKTDWESQHLFEAKVDINKPSERQAQMIEFSQKHCLEHGIGGEFPE